MASNKCTNISDEIRNIDPQLLKADIDQAPGALADDLREQV